MHSNKKKETGSSIWFNSVSSQTKYCKNIYISMLVSTTCLWNIHQMRSLYWKKKWF